MRPFEKFIIIIIILGFLICASAYILFYTEEPDTEPPRIDAITGNFTLIAGQTAVITAMFSDNVNVTEAILYYKIAGTTNWNTISILSGITTINIPSDSTNDYYYYITVDDAAGNGPVGDPSIDGSLFYTITIKPNNSNNDDEDFIHTVFVEESTSQNCRYCPNVAAILEKMESAQNIRFYYVSMIIDNNKAAQYLSSTYNSYADPTLYIDGGYRVVLGGLHPEINYTSAIQAAENRITPNIKVSITAEYKNTTNTLTTNVLVKNAEKSIYTGRLRVYLTELISSQFNDYNGRKYRNSFVDFIINEDISIAAKSNMTFSANTSLDTLDYENLKLIAVVFNATGKTAFSDPPTNGYPFTAHYADATNATYVATGLRNLPPEVGILSPQQGKIYFRGNLFLQILYKNSLLRNTWLIGKSSINTYAKDDSGIAKVEFYLNNDLVATLTNPPYNWNIPSKFFKKPLIPMNYTVIVKAYDDTGKTATASIDFKAWWVF